jgi:hypothetical protein
LEVARACLGTEYWSAEYPAELLSIGSVFSDVSAATAPATLPNPELRAGLPGACRRSARWRWLARQKEEAGARSVVGSSDQFMARVLREGGREEVLEIMRVGARTWGWRCWWPNGLEPRKGHARRRGLNRPGTGLGPRRGTHQRGLGLGRQGRQLSTPTCRPSGFHRRPRELRQAAAVGCWSIASCCGQPSVPACRRCPTGVIIGFDDDTEETFEIAAGRSHPRNSHQDLTSINPQLIFQVASFAISPIPGTGQGKLLREPACCASTIRRCTAACGRPGA